MLKKVFAIGAMCAMSCGVSFGKTTALELVESSLKDVKSLGIEYSCYGDDKYAKCQFKDLNTTLFGLKNAGFEISLTDYQLKQKAFGDIVSNFGQDVNKFVPNRFECSSESNLVVDDLDSYGVEQCVLKSDVSNLRVDLKTKMHSKAYRYKTMPSILLKNIALIQKISKDFDDADEKYNNKVSKLREDRDKQIGEIYDEIEHFGMLLESKGSHQHGCKCGECKENEEVKEFKEMHAIKTREAREIREKYGKEYDRLQKEYDDEVQGIFDSAITILKMYDFELQEARVYIKADTLADTLFTLSNKRFFAFNKNIPLTKEQELMRAEKKKRITAKYYSELEASRAGMITLVKESPYLSDNLRATLQKVIIQHVKLFDPNSRTRSVKVLITPLDNVPFNLGDELQKFRNIYVDSNYHDDDNATKAYFDIINKYDIRAVREWPLD